MRNCYAAVPEITCKHQCISICGLSHKIKILVAITLILHFREILGLEQKTLVIFMASWFREEDHKQPLWLDDHA